MSRNNLIPKGELGELEICLVPLWDMINHKAGEVTTDFDPDSRELIFYSMEHLAPKSQILMDYGKRTSAEFLMFSGFVPETNLHNNVRIVLGVSKSDQFSSKREKLLKLIGLECPLVRYVTGKLESLMDTIAFARVFVMNVEQLDSHLSMSDPGLSGLRNSPLCSDNSLDVQAVAFLTMRIRLLLSAYGSVLSENQSDFQKLTPVQRYCERLRAQEMEILHLSIQCLKRACNVPD